MTYPALIYLDIEYTKGNTVVVKKDHMIGRMPMMLRSSNCALSGKCFEIFFVFHQLKFAKCKTHLIGRAFTKRDGNEK